MPWTLSKRFTFEAAHHLPYHEGKCCRQHGHSWGLIIEASSRTLHAQGSQRGMVLDYGEISEQVGPLLAEILDHHDLNVTTGLESPTSEALAEWIYQWLKPSLPELSAVRIEETCTSGCRYTPDS